MTSLLIFTLMLKKITQLFFISQEIELIEKIINCHHTHYKEENLDAWIEKQDNLKV